MRKKDFTYLSGQFAAFSTAVPLFFYRQMLAISVLGGGGGGD